MWYLIYAEDVADSLSLRQSARPAHLERLQTLRDAGRLLLLAPIRPLIVKIPAVLASQAAQ